MYKSVEIVAAIPQLWVKLYNFWFAYNFWPTLQKNDGWNSYRRKNFDGYQK